MLSFPEVSLFLLLEFLPTVPPPGLPLEFLLSVFEPVLLLVETLLLFSGFLELLFISVLLLSGLEELFEIADIGLGSMGFHLIGAQNTISSTLKTREYLAHGLPFLSACNEDIFMKYPDTGFFRHYPDDETDIPIDDVIRFYDELLNRYSGNEDRLREDIHEFAAKTVDMSVVMRPVVDFIKS